MPKTKKNKILGIDAAPLATTDKYTGVDRYCYEMISGLIERCPSDWKIRLYSPHSLPQFSQHRSVEVVVLRPPRPWLLRLSLHLLFNKPDRLFVPGTALPFNLPSESVTTLHDIAFDYIPKTYSWYRRQYLRWAVYRSIRRCPRLITISTTTQQDLIRGYQATGKQLKVIYLGYDPQPFTAGDRQPQLLFVSRLETKKGVLTLLNAFDVFHQQHPDYQLILVGKPGKGYKQIVARAQQIGDSVHILGFISDQQRQQLYATSAVYVLPSLYEGFGMTVLEAMSAGLPVITSRAGSLPEVVDKAAEIVSPGNPQALAEAIDRVISDAELRDRLVQQGRKRATQFSWSRCAQQTADLLFAERLCYNEDESK